MYGLGILLLSMFNAASVNALTVGSLGSKRPVTGSGIGAGRLFRVFSPVFPLLGELLSVDDMAGSRTQQDGVQIRNRKLWSDM